MDQARFDRQIESILAVQASHKSQIKGLIRAAQLQQNSLKRLEARAEKESEKARREQKRLDERLDQLVSAIGELIRRTPPFN